VGAVRALVLAELEEIRNHKPGILEGKIGLPYILFFACISRPQVVGTISKKLVPLAPHWAFSFSSFWGQRQMMIEE
jgi:hypothetical protein